MHHFFGLLKVQSHHTLKENNASFPGSMFSYRFPVTIISTDTQNGRIAEAATRFLDQTLKKGIHFTPKRCRIE